MKNKKVLVRFTKQGCYKKIGETAYISIREAEAWAGCMKICEVIDKDVDVIMNNISGIEIMTIKPKDEMTWKGSDKND